MRLLPKPANVLLPRHERTIGATEEMSGVIERVASHNDDSLFLRFCVLRVKTKERREETTVVGSYWEFQGKRL